MAEERPRGVSVGDVRYSFDTGGFLPIWGLSIEPTAAQLWADIDDGVWRGTVEPRL